MNGVRKFFKSVAIIDDELFSTGTGRRAQRPTELFEHFQEHGAVISPLKFESLGLIDRAVRLALQARLTILDWNLIETREQGQDASDAAFTIVRRMLEEKDQGMQWLIIYTDNPLTNLPMNLLSRLSAIWAATPPQIYPGLVNEVTKAIHDLQQATGAPPTPAVTQAPPLLLNGLFVSFTSKEITADAVFAHFEETLLRFFGPLPLALLEIAATMDRTSYKTIQEFTKPFGLPVYLQALTSGLKDAELIQFLFDMYVQNVTEALQVTPQASTQLRGHRFSALKRGLSYSASHPDDFRDFLAAVDQRGGELKIGRWKWPTLIPALAKAESMEALMTLSGSDEILRASGLPGKPSAQVLRIGLELLAAYVEVKEQRPATDPLTYLDQLRDQVLRFTRLLKYVEVNVDEEPQTGTIYADQSVPGQYLLCITPVCDVAHSKTAGLKFIVGNSMWPPLDHPERRAGVHPTYVPLPGNLEYVVWDFSNTVVHRVSGDRPALDQWIALGLDVAYFKKNSMEIVAALPRLPYEASLAILLIALECDPEPAFCGCVAEGLGLISALTRELLENGGEPVAWPTLLEDAGQAWDKARLLRSLKPSHFSMRYQPVLRFKREYAQQVMNRYVSYQARAGVTELFYKENAWQGHLLKLVRQ